MSEVVKTPAVAEPSGENPYAATRLHMPDECVSRQEEDIALAAELLQAGIINDREIAAAISGWTIHGSVALADYLAKGGVLSSEQLEVLRRRAVARVDRARRSVVQSSEAPAAGKSMLLATLERLDGSGRVAKLLGVTVAASGGENEARVTEGRYELIRKLGQGGLGRIWLARDVNLNRHVALKEISHASDAADALVERFKHEAEITGRLDHPSIVPIYQLGEDRATKRVFYTMRFLGRTTLQDAINEYHERRQEGDEDPMLLRHLLTAFVNVCHAIGYAHSRKVIHRDLKPENIVIDSFGQVIVIDWGLAKIIDDTSVESLIDSETIGSGASTSEGQVLGTPLYMAPEQAAGRLDEIDGRTDIYGLGAILFAIVTGNAPHEKTQKESADSGLGARGMISVIASGVAPSAEDANPNVDPALAAICTKAMARRRYARYQQATDLAEDVQRWMAGERVSAYREKFWQRVNRWVAQHQRLSQSIVAAAIVVLVALTTLAMAARQNGLVSRHARYAQMDSNVREVEIQMRYMWTELAKDSRLLASLPPIQGIINARSGEEGDDEDVWTSQLQTTIAGMLQANRNYLAISFEAKHEDGAEDIVRAERSPGDPTYVRVLPASRLLSLKADPLIAAVSELNPGDLKYSLEPRARHGEGSSRAERLAVATPIYSDASGDFFGMTVIEADASKRVREVLTELGAVDCEIFVADGHGEVWGSTDPRNGVRVAEPGQSIPGLPKEVADRLSEKGAPFRLRSQNEYVAQRFYVDPTGRGVLIFARLPEAN